MPKRISRPNRPKDVNEWARQMVEESAREAEPLASPPPTAAQISAFMSSMGRKGGKIGGKRRLETMTAEERSAAASKAAKARWGNR